MQLIQEEARILHYLKTHPVCPYSQLLQACLPGAASGSAQHMLMNLEWLGYVNVFFTQNGEPTVLQITSRGRSLSSVS